VSFDFDDTLVDSSTELPNRRAVSAMNRHLRQGDEVVIVTARHRAGVAEIFDFLTRYFSSWTIPVYATGHRLKGPLLHSTNVSLHYDDDPAQLASAREYGISTVPWNLAAVLYFRRRDGRCLAVPAAWRPIADLLEGPFGEYLRPLL